MNILDPDIENFGETLEFAKQSLNCTSVKNGDPNAIQIVERLGTKALEMTQHIKSLMDEYDSNK